MKKLTLVLTALGLASLAAVATAQIRQLSLYEMVEQSDRALYGEIVSNTVHRVPGGEEGEFLYFTRLLVEGDTLVGEDPITVEVCFPGGFIGEDEGYWHSESPGADEVAVGNRIVAFYKWHEGLAGKHSANWLYANHGGVYRTAEGPAGRVVLGRGEGYAVARNLRLSDLRLSASRIQEEINRERENR